MTRKTIRLMYPDWQSSNREQYFFGAQLLSFLAPKNPNQEVIQVPVDAPVAGSEQPMENGVRGQTAVKKNTQAAMALIEKASPDRIITFGGNCMVSQAPFAYLNEKYSGDVGVIWIDTHPDISTPSMFFHEHAMVLGNLLGHGDPALASMVKRPLKPSQILYVGLQDVLPAEKEMLATLQISYEIQTQRQLDVPAVQAWIKQHGWKHIVVHYDLDVLDTALFKSQYTLEPGSTSPVETALGRMGPAAVGAILKEVSTNSDLVGFTIAEYFPYDALMLKNQMNELSLFHD